MQKFLKANNFYWLLVVVCVFVFSLSRFWDKKPIIDWDMTLYYSYLPALFIYDDLKFEQPTAEWGKRHFYMNSDARGNRYVKMTGGLAIMYSPFFAIGHLYASLNSAHPADGFSAPYRFALLASSLFFALWGLYILRLVLQRFFSPWVANLSVVLIYIGSNMPHYSFVEPMSHVYNFFLVSAILFLSFKFCEKPSIKLAIPIGALAGLMVLIRPTNVLVLLFPMIYLASSGSLKSAGEWVKYGIIAAFFAFLAMSPQLFYWHYMTGNWIIYSYNDEHFFFLDPHIWDGLFSYRKGWFVYSPLLLLAVAGFSALWQQSKLLFSSSLTVISFALWVNFSWWCWWYGGGFGARSLIDFLPFMAFGLAAFLQWLGQQKILLKAPLIVIISFLSVWSIFMNKQYKSSIIHYDSMSKELFWKQFFKDHFVKDYESFLEHPDYDAAKKGEEDY
tara:strand:- start:304 stop:1641 length:1338 start_codon:yes stop_codon:yes gene_type:complete